MISIIVPIYNAEKWLGKCLESLINQTIFNKLELVLVDDGSNDKSGLIIDEYAKKYTNIICTHTSNQGVSNARNVGLDLCHGEYITFVDADDYFDSCFIENLLNAMDKDCDIVCGGFVAEYSNKSITKCPSKEFCFDSKTAYYQFILGQEFDPHVTDKLFKREVIGEERFDSSIAIAEDRLFLFQCLKRVRKIKLIPIANYHYVINDFSACRREFNIKKYHSILVSKRICEEIILIYPEYQNWAESMLIDVKCQGYGDMYQCKAIKRFKKEYFELKKDIKEFSIKKKYKYSSKKHFFAFLAARIHPSLYCFLKNDMKLQYKK